MGGSCPIQINLDISLSDVENGSKEILKKIRPAWNLSCLKFKYFDEGITNVLVGCFTADSLSTADDVVMIRIFGKKTDLIIDREAEKNNMIKYSKAGLCPPLYAQFNNGLAYGFARGITLDEKSVRDPKIRKLIAKEMVKLHSLNKDPRAKSELFTKLDQWLKVVPENFEDPRKQKLLKERVPTIAELTKEVRELQTCLDSMPYPAVDSHNDLLLKNIIYNEKEDRVTFIDHEYGMLSYQPYDIGNHFCEYAGIGEVTDYTLYPDKAFQLDWIRNYLEEWNGNPGSRIPDQDVWKMYCWVNKCALAAHLFWGIWGLIQARYSEIDFDYLSYGILRLDEYFAKKETFLALQ